MRFSAISFDLQGTLSDASFSDEFWLETLPALFSGKDNIRLARAKELLRNRFEMYGVYDHRYYSAGYWMQELKQDITFEDITKKMKNRPLFFRDSLDLIQELRGKAMLVIISSTTGEFINAELGRCGRYFDRVYSSLDDFNIAGKPVHLYQKIAGMLDIRPERIIHIGDSHEMDIQNAGKAGYKTFYFDRSRPREDLIESLKQELGLSHQQIARKEF